MNYHIEHHMYAAVPCYNLAKLHEVIRHDLPPSQSAWSRRGKRSAPFLKRQEADPSYQYAPPLPTPAPATT
ncbi:MAG: fatty acid desaturase [Candidatus Roseilinea sp.]|uniref:fatty acid desaturase n=1 Tax=Candidatus Roseilinea sp. TaxID=2838777 RepID=UPI00404A6C53